MSITNKLVVLALSTLLITPAATVATANIAPTVAEAKNVKTLPKRFRGNWVHYRGDIAYKQITISKHSLRYWYSFKRKDSTGGKLGKIAYVSYHGNHIQFGFGTADSDYHGKLVTKKIHGKNRRVLKFTQPRTNSETHTIHAQYIRR